METGALLVDFGGVLTSSVPGAFRAAGGRLFGRPALIEQLLHQVPEAADLLVAHESGRLGVAGFEAGFGELLLGHGITADKAVGMVRAIQDRLRPDEMMLAAVRHVRGHGVPVALVSNAFGEDPYAGYDLPQLVDVAVVSTELGLRKPSRRIYQVACRRLGVEPGTAVLVDDLAMNLAGAARLGIGGILHVESSLTVAELQRRFCPPSCTGLVPGQEIASARPDLPH